MRSYYDLFKDEIDVTDGTVVLTKEKFDAIVAEVVADFNKSPKTLGELEKLWANRPAS